MRLLWIIILIGLGFQLEAQSTYFNMRYPETNAWGSGTRAIVNQNGSLYLNIGYNFNVAGFKSQTFSTMDITDGSNTLGVRIETDSTEFFSGSLIGYSQGGFYDVMSVESITDSLVYRYKVVKYDDQGDTVFTKTYIDTSLFLSILDVTESSDGGLAFIGVTQVIPANQSGTEDMILIKTDSLGNEQWRKTYGNTSNFERGYSIALTTDGGYILGGGRWVPGIIIQWEEERPYIIKTDSIGNVEWEKVYGSVDTANMPAYGITETFDGGYAFVGGVGQVDYTTNDPQYPWVVKLNSIGDILWTQENDEGRASYFNSKYTDVIELADGSIVVSGHQFVNNPDTANTSGLYRVVGTIAKYSANGDSIWSRNYMHPENMKSQNSYHVLNSIVQTDDGGFAAAGYLISAPPDTGTQDTWVVKVDSFGCLVQGCEVVSVPQIETSIASLKIYPNPVRNILNIEITPNGNKHQFNFELYDILGKRVHTQKLIPYSNTISVSGLTSGIYTYKIDEFWGKIVVE
jgi:hypothetical protein